MLSSYYTDVDSYIKYGHMKTNEIQDMSYHLQNMFEIYFFISGSVNYFIEKNVYQLKYGDLFVINNNEIHRATFRSGEGYERIVVMFEPEIVRLFSSNSFNLLDCFINRPKGEQNKIGLNKVQIDKIMEITAKMDSVFKVHSDASSLLKLAYLIELLVFINEVFNNTKSNESNQILSKKLVPILEYIDSNLNSDLSLHSLEEKFYINKYYLSSLFKKDTGVNIHEYIILKRIAKAKILLSEGYGITEVCQMSGFCDYAHFIRTFKLHIGTSPGQYKKQHALVEKKNMLSL